MNLTPRCSLLHMPAHQNFALLSMRVVYGYDLDFDNKDEMMLNHDAQHSHNILL